MKSPLLQSLFDEEERTPLTVSELTARVKSVLERSFKSTWLSGEIVNFSEAASGHWYFNLRDEHSQLRAACYRGQNSRIRFKPFDGLEVRVSGKLSVYEPKGEYQILVESLEPIGEGAMKVAFEQLKLKLEREGLFAPEVKRALPFFPKRIAVVTSPNGAAIHDILQVLTRRTKTVDVLFVPTRVQGESAPQEIRAAIEAVNEVHFKSLNAGDESNLIDVMIVGRGGGAMEDLWAFNDERVARAIRSSLIPVISAVGHETDFTIADFVADYRAPTPSAAAEIVAAQESQIELFLQEQLQNLRQAIEFRLLEARSELQAVSSAKIFAEIPARVREARQKIENNRLRLNNALQNRLERKRRQLDNSAVKLAPQIVTTNFVRASAKLENMRQKLHVSQENRIGDARERFALNAEKLNALSPLAVLGRGFSIVQKADGQIVTRAADTQNGEDLRVTLAEGKLKCRVVSEE